MKLVLSISIAAAYGISLRLLFVSFGESMAIMSLAFFFIVPFLIGYLTIFLLPYRESHTSKGAFFKPWLTCLVVLAITCLFRIEGLICWAMAYPIFAILAGVGGIVAFNRKRRRAMKNVDWDFDKDKWENPGTIKASLLFFIPLFVGLLEGNRSSSFEDLTIEKKIDIPASPGVVWSALTAPRQNVGHSKHLSICGLLGFPQHLSTTLDTLAIGKQRIATYEKGLTFVETVTQMEPLRRFEVSITTDPAKISKAIMDEHIVIGGEHIQMQGDTYTLQPLPDGKTRLSLVSHFSINTPFNWYARLWSTWLMSDVLGEELQSLNAAAALTEKAQSQKLNDIYAGAQLYTTVYDGMQINNIAFYFRSDGTFNDKFNISDWKNNVSGTYTIANNTIQLKFKDGRESTTYKLNTNGNLESTVGIKHTLHKLKKISSLPVASYQSKSASSRGGMGTGMPNVAAFSSGYLAFDGKGNFSFNRTGTVGLSGETVGGKFEKNNSAAGTYQLGDGEITLTFNNGSASKHSLFYSPPNEENLILLDGDFYFREEDKKTVPASTPTPATTKETSLPTPADLLNKLRTHYGGEAIDKLTAIKETFTITGNLQGVVLTDLTHNKVRAEVRQAGKLLLAKQVEGNDGWRWIQGTIKPLSPEEKNELQLTVYQGILGLHKKLNSYFLTGNISRSGDDYMLTFLINKNKLVYLIAPDYTLKANAYSINEAPNFSVYKNFKQTNGITYPATTESFDGKNTITINTIAIEFNPTLTEDAWKKP